MASSKKKKPSFFAKKQPTRKLRGGVVIAYQVVPLPQESFSVPWGEEPEPINPNKIRVAAQFYAVPPGWTPDQGAAALDLDPANAIDTWFVNLVREGRTLKATSVEAAIGSSLFGGGFDLNRSQKKSLEEGAIDWVYRVESGRTKPTKKGMLNGLSSWG